MLKECNIYKSENATIHVGDCLNVLPTLESGSVNCCVTSPPYWGLRDYGHADQLGLEKTPEEYVAKMVQVFREVRRVLRDDGTLWLNLGDSYWGGKGENGSSKARATADERGYTQSRGTVQMSKRQQDGTHNTIKPKDLVGIPWRVAFALQQPYYTGRIKDERDRIWLAAMLDAEGCMFIHKRKSGQSNGQGYERQNDTYSPGIEICNTSVTIVDRIMEIVGKGSICTQSPEQNGRRKQTIYRWNLRTTECRDLVRELYPHIVAKKHQARILCGCPSSGENAEAAHAALIGLHRGSQTTVDFPAPSSMFEPGWYLRQDCIWSKPNPMPESVTDRCTKAHEYIFLLAKSAKYHYDAEAVKEPVSEWTVRRSQQGTGKATHAPHSKIMAGDYACKTAGRDYKKDVERGRNRRSVWTITPKPFRGAHFAVFPPDLAEPCILAGCPVGGTVLDPFNGAGTCGMVATKNGRKYVGIELNPEYAAMSVERIEKARGEALLC
jgi:DNA modification methylase